jgi:GntR family transcriptional regulator
MARLPLYKAAETEMIRRIKTGEWAPGLRLPNEFGLADEFGVSQGTMRRALMSLESMGMLDRKPGRGTVVADPRTAPARRSAPGYHRILGIDGTPAVFEVFRPRNTVRPATPEEADIFGSARVHELERILKAEGVRVGLDLVTVPAGQAPGLPETLPVALDLICAEIALPLARIDDQLVAEVTSMGESVALAVDRHTGLLTLTRTARDADGTPVARQVTRLVTDRISYTVTLSE